MNQHVAMSEKSDFGKECLFETVFSGYLFFDYTQFSKYSPVRKMFFLGKKCI